MRLFNAPVVVRIANKRFFDQIAFPDEEAHVATAVDKRKREFRAGRAAARSALVELGAAPVAIPISHDRQPAWPTGYLGSITHCDGCAAAVVARTADLFGLGFDIEVRSALPEDLTTSVAHSAELHQLSALTNLSLAEAGTVIFSAKEAFYKAYYPAAKSYLGFHDVMLSFGLAPYESEIGNFTIKDLCASKPAGKVTEALKGFWWLDDGFVYCGAVAEGH